MAFADPTTPNLADFTTYVYNQGVSSADLPSTSEYLVWALGYAQNIALIPPPAMPSIVYVMAVYNLGMHQLLTLAQDIPPSTFFQATRATYGLLSFSGGTVLSASDSGTQSTLDVPSWIKEMPLSALGYLKTPWGREYISYAQMYGPSIVGVS